MADVPRALADACSATATATAGPALQPTRIAAASSSTITHQAPLTIAYTALASITIALSPMATTRSAAHPSIAAATATRCRHDGVLQLVLRSQKRGVPGWRAWRIRSLVSLRPRLR